MSTLNELFRDPVGVAKEVFAGFQRDDGTGLSAEAAYRLVFALPALAIFFASVSAIAAQYTGVDAFQTLLDRAREGLPPEVFQTLELVFSSVEEQSGIGVLSIGLVIAMWSGSNALAAIVKAINRAHGLEDKRGIVQQRAIALGLTLGLSLLMISSFVLLFFGQEIGTEVASMLGYGDVFALIWNIARWPVLLVLFMAALAMLYRFGPAEEIRTRWVIPGAVIATVLWLIASFGFNIYLSVADPGSAYGVLGGIIALLLFLYISSIVIVVGGEINATLIHRQTGEVGRLALVDHPLDIMSPEIQDQQDESRARLATWIIAGILVAGAVFGGLFGRRPDGGADH
jgi:membrane protein